MSKKYYVDKKKFHESFVNWHEELLTNPDSPVPLYICQQFMKMVDKIANRPNWNRYTWLDDMKGNALLNCIKYARVYDIHRKSDPFSYFTSAINNIFLQTVQKNNKELEKMELYMYCNIPVYDYDVNMTPSNFSLPSVDELKIKNDMILSGRDDNLTNLDESFFDKSNPDDTIDNHLGSIIENSVKADVVHVNNSDDVDNDEDDELVELGDDFVFDDGNEPEDL